LHQHRIDEARHADILGVARRVGAVSLKKVTAVEWVGPCMICGGRDRYSVNIAKRLFHCRGCGIGGDVIDIVRHALGLNFAEAIEFLIGTEVRSAVKVVHATRRSAPAHDPSTEASVARIITELRPIRGTDGERYLKERRRIDTAAIADILERTDAIGWHDAIFFREPGHPLDGRKIGAVIGVMTDPISAAPTGAISRTYLDAEGRKVAKARTFGAPAGLVRLSEDADVLEGIFLAEGLETALAAMAIGLRPIWSTGATALMAKFPVLAGIEALSLLADHDESGAGETAARQAEARWLQAGREVRIFRVDQFGDLNDAIAKAGAK